MEHLLAEGYLCTCQESSILRGAYLAQVASPHRGAASRVKGKEIKITTIIHTEVKSAAKRAGYFSANGLYKKGLIIIN